MDGVLFVCTGNICRSPMAEGLLRRALDDQAVVMTVDSAGMHAREGLAPEPLAAQVAADRDVDITALRSRRFTVADFARYRTIVAMDSGHLDYLQALAPAGWPGLLSLLRDEQGTPFEVPDPYGRPLRHYRRTASLIERGLPALLAHLGA